MDRAFRGAFGQIAATTVLIIPIRTIADNPWRHAAPSAAILAALGGLMLLSMASANIIFFSLLATAGATNTSL